MNTLSLFNQTSYRCSQTVTNSYSTSFSSAIRLLHPDLHAPIHGIYGFVRLADEVVDTFHEFQKTSLLAQFKQDTYLAIDQNISLNPILHSFQLTVNRYQINKALIEAFFDSMFSDLEKKDWATEEELDEYIYGSAEVVGLMCLQVFCEGDCEKASALKPAASALGAAFQKVNFLRDLGDDLVNLQRSYFPQLNFNYLHEKDKMIIEDEIQQDFNRAYEGITKLPIKARFGVMVAYKYYFCLFQKIRNMSPEKLMERRVRVPTLQKLFLMLHTSVGSKLRWNKI